MTFNKRNAMKWLLLSTLTVAMTACSQDDIVNENIDETNPGITEPLYPVNFKCITLNRGGSYQGEVPSISYVAKDGSVYPDYLKTVNNFQINDRPSDALQIKDKLYLLHGNFFVDNGVIEVNPNTFQITRTINLTDKLICNALVRGNENEIIIGGEDHATDNNLAVISLSAQNDEGVITKEICTGFPIHAMTRIGDKIFLASASSDAPLAVIDVNNISEGGIRYVLDVCRMTDRSNKIVKDKNGNLWLANRAKSPITMVCFDPVNEKVVKEITLPSTVSTLKETAYTLDNEGTTLYIRNHKAFYAINIDKDIELDEPHYEYREHVGLLKDLKMNEDGKLLIINQRQEPFAQSELIEFNPKAGNEWLGEMINIGNQGNSIFIPRHEKSL